MALQLERKVHLSRGQVRLWLEQMAHHPAYSRVDNRDLQDECVNLSVFWVIPERDSSSLLKPSSHFEVHGLDSPASDEEQRLESPLSAKNYMILDRIRSTVWATHGKSFGAWINGNCNAGRDQE